MSHVTLDNPESRARKNLAKMFEGYSPPRQSLEDAVRFEIGLLSQDTRAKGAQTVFEAVLPPLREIEQGSHFVESPLNGNLVKYVRPLVDQCLQEFAQRRKDLGLDGADEPTNVSEGDGKKEAPTHIGIGHVMRIVAPYSCVVNAHVDGHDVHCRVPKELTPGSFPAKGAQVKVKLRPDAKKGWDGPDPAAEILEVLN